LVTSWYWLIFGTFGTVVLAAVLPVTMRRGLAQMQQASASPPSADITTGVMAVIITLMIVFFTVFFVLLPIAFVVFYRREDVALTCHHRDPVERWTERTPLPVLGATVAFFLGSVYALLLAATAPMLPVFGHYLTGFPAAGCLALLAGLDLYLAIALYRLKLSGWWIAIIVAPLRMCATALSYNRAALMQAYAKMGWSSAQLQILNSNPILRGRLFIGMGVIMMLGFFGYLLWIKRYFRAPVAPTPTEAFPAVAS
jgi:predicted secreted protein